MGIHGIYKEIGAGRRIALSKLAVQKFEATGRPLRIAIDVSIWLFQIQASKGGTNPAPRTFYYRLLRMIANSIHPVFVFDGPNKPPFKRGKKTGANVSSVPDFLAKQLIKQFGFPIHYAPGEAEAECALLQREGIVDAVLSEDVDTLMFGSGMTIRNWSPEPGMSGKTPTHVNVYDAAETKRQAGLDREGMILVALMSGGDYVPEGIPGCGPKTACAAARAGFGRDLCRINPKDRSAMQAWRERLQHEIKTNESKFFGRKHPSMKIPEDFPRLDILGYYTHPVVSSQASLDTLRRSIKWDQEIDFPGLRAFTHDAFDWIRLEGAKHFIRNLAPVVLIRALRTRAAAEKLTDDPDVLKEDEALWVKGIHGKREHPITDNTPELRVSYTPIELVKIDLSKEDPDEIASTQGLAAEGSAEADDFIDIDEGDDDEDGPRKRGPTKFDPTKPARTWVMETFVEIGVPVTVEDWKAGLRQPRRAATSKTATKAAPKPRARRTKTTGNLPQPSISQFAKVTKPGVSLSQRLSQAQKDSEASALIPKPCKPPTRDVLELDLLSPSPVKSRPPAPSRPPTEKVTRERSLSPVLELPSSVTKRRRRAPMQRAQTLPASPNAPIVKASTPPLHDMDAVMTLDLAMTSPVAPSPFAGPAKVARSGTARDPPAARRTRTQRSVTASPSKARQTTLEGWVTPSERQEKQQPHIAAPPPPPAQPKFQATLDTLDLTLSSPEQPALSETTATKPRRTAPSNSTRPPLKHVSSNTSTNSTSSTTTTATRSAKPTKPTSRRRSPPISDSTTTDLSTVSPIDLTALSSPPPQHAHHSATHDPSSTTGTPEPGQPTLRRSPRAHPSSPPPRALPPPAPAPAAWKQHQRKKHIIHLRQSLAGTFSLAEVEGSPEKPGASTEASAATGSGGGETRVLKGKERRVWRMSQVQVLDLT